MGGTQLHPILAGKYNKHNNYQLRKFLGYTAPHQDDIFTYHASDMILACHSDVSYLSETSSRSQSGGHLFLTDNNETPRNMWVGVEHLPNNQSSYEFGSRIIK